MNAEEILYRGSTDANDNYKKTVTAMENGREIPLDPYPEFINYLGGFSWGYPGTGPQNLAKAIAWHYYRDDPQRETKFARAWRPLLNNVILPLPADLPRWNITRGMVESVLASRAKAVGA